MTLLALHAVLAVLLLATATTSAAPGDQRVIQGTLVWPQELTAQRVAAGERVVVVQGDLGTRYTANLTAATDVPAPLQAGTRVVVVAREGQQSEVTALRIQSSAPQAARAAAEGRTVVRGSVTALSGSTLILTVPGGQSVAVDISGLEASAREILTAGRAVTLYGVVVNGALLAAQGIELDYTPSALPRAP
jgi:hypothetical protein